MVVVEVMIVVEVVEIVEAVVVVAEVVVFQKSFSGISKVFSFKCGRVLRNN